MSALPGTRPSARPYYNSPVDPLAYSRYARQLVAARPELREELERAERGGWTREAMQAFLRERGGGDEDALHSALRKLRQRVLLRMMARDLSGTADLDEVCGTMSALAGVASIRRSRFSSHGWRRAAGSPSSR